MKKKVLFVAFCMAVACTGALVSVLYGGNDNNSEANLLSENIEALASGENSGNEINCYTSLVYEFNSRVVECTSCKLLINYTDKWNNFHNTCIVH